MGQQILVIGLGTFGSIVAAELSALGHEVMGCDRDPRVVAEHADRLTQVFEIDATDARTRSRAVGPADFDVVVVATRPVGHDPRDDDPRACPAPSRSLPGRRATSTARSSAGSAPAAS